MAPNEHRPGLRWSQDDKGLVLLDIRWFRILARDPGIGTLRIHMSGILWVALLHRGPKIVASGLNGQIRVMRDARPTGTKKLGWDKRKMVTRHSLVKIIVRKPVSGHKSHLLHDQGRRKFNIRS
jgi:hypothetical protein